MHAVPTLETGAFGVASRMGPSRRPGQRWPECSTWYIGAVDEDARSRRERRLQQLQIVRFDLGDEPSEDLRATTTAQERLDMMWPLAVRAWRLSGREMPSYRRSEMPGRIIRGRQ